MPPLPLCRLPLWWHALHGAPVVCFRSACPCSLSLSTCTAPRLAFVALDQSLRVAVYDLLPRTLVTLLLIAAPPCPPPAAQPGRR